MMIEKLTDKEREAEKKAIRDAILVEFRTGKVDPSFEIAKQVAALKASNGAEARSILSLYELAARTKSDADRKAFAEEYSDWYVRALESAVDLVSFGKNVPPKKGTSTVNEKPSEKPVDMAAVERRVAAYDCRGHWWGMTPGFVSLTLIGAVAGLVKRSMK